VRNLGAGQAVTLRGFGFDRPVVFADCAGVVWVEACTFHVPDFENDTQPIFVDNCAAAHFNRCLSQAGMQIGVNPSGLSARNSNVQLYGCTLTGAAGYGATSDGGSGVNVSGGSLFASATTFHGGDSGCGGNGLCLQGTAPGARTLDCVFAAGAVGSCSSTTGVGVRVDAGSHTLLSGTSRAFDATSPARVGQTTTLTFRGVPGERVILAAALAPGRRYFPGLKGVLETSLTSLSTRVFGLVPPSGVLQVSVPVPPLGGAGQVFFLQAAFVSSGGITLAGGSALILLVN